MVRRWAVVVRGVVRRVVRRVGRRVGRIRVLGVIVVFVVVALGASTEPIAADGQSAWGTITDGVPEAIVVVSHDGTLGSWSGGGTGARWRCGYYAIDAPVTSVLDPSPVVNWTAGPVNPVRGEFYILACDDSNGVRVRATYLKFDPGDPFGGIAATERAIDEARRRLEIPEPVPRVNPPDAQLVGLPMWMWLDQPWERVWASASIGSVWAGVDAWPETSMWEFDDGTRIWCDRGIEYDTARSPRDQRSGCTHTFTRTSAWSPGGIEMVRVTVTWGVEWTSSEQGGEPLGTLTRTAEFPVRVLEAQALVR
jgi:hypothetical protein